METRILFDRKGKVCPVGWILLPVPGKIILLGERTVFYEITKARPLVALGNSGKMARMESIGLPYPLHESTEFYPAVV